MLTVPLTATPSQVVQCVLNNQTCTIRVYQKFFGVFMDLLVNDVTIITGVECEYGELIVQSLYLGFVGDFMWSDTQGTSDPEYAGIGTRWFLEYLLPTEVPTLPPGVE